MEANVLKWAVKPQIYAIVDTFTDDLRRRMTFAFNRWRRSEFPEDLDQTELGRRVADAIKRKKGAYTQTAVAGWLLGKIPRDPGAAGALSEELGLEPGWLYFGRGDEPVGWKEALSAMLAHEKKTAGRKALRTGGTVVVQKPDKKREKGA